jgi:UPF0755 protein
MMRWLVRVALVLLALAAVAAAWLWRDYSRFADQPLAIGPAEQVLDVPLGTPFNRIVRDLRRRGMTEAPLLYWRALAWQMRVAEGLHAGEYALEQGLTPRSLLERMAAGRVIQHYFTIVEGWNVRELRAALAREAALVQDSAGMGEAELMAAVGLPGIPAEGRFLPETYAYTKGQSDLDVLRRARQALDRALADAWAGRAADLPLASAEELLVLASIVEKETGRAEERARIAGVFARRLHIGMRLQTDPTVIYGIGPAFDGNLTRRHLETDTPWNTYTRGGLPPTPIALAGRAALEASARPADGRELYFVARGDGSHQFSATLAEHNAAVRRYQLRGR